MLANYTAYGKTWTIEEQDMIFIWKKKEKVPLGYNHHRAWKSALIYKPPEYLDDLAAADEDLAAGRTRSLRI